MLCDIACPYGYLTDENGCPVCGCQPNPASCATLARDECATRADCAIVTFGDPTSADFKCCERDVDGRIICGEPPPPTGCISDAECREGQVCDTTNYCDPPPDCAPGDACPAVCYGRCITAGSNGECYSDYDCLDSEYCAYSSDATGCNDFTDPNCFMPPTGTCEPVVCPAVEPLCSDGSTPSGYETVPHGCPVPICTGACETLTPEECQARPDCESQFTIDECVCPPCDATTNEACPACDCPPGQFQCVTRPWCFSDQECRPGEFCDFSYDPCPECDRLPMGLCVPRASRCEGLDEATCLVVDGCKPVYLCECGPNVPPEQCVTTNDCNTYSWCAPVEQPYCSRDADCGPGYRCNTCPPDPSCPECDVCGPPVCEPNPVTRCTSDAQCGPTAHCELDVNCVPTPDGTCTGTCVPNETGCDAITDETTCSATRGCQPVYEPSTCNDGCHDDEGRIISCGPCTDIACPVMPFARCEATPGFQPCCANEGCDSGEACVFRRDINLGECIPNTQCGGGNFGECPAGSECTVIGCASWCDGVATDPNGGTAGCCPEYACVQPAQCATDDDCSPGMFCNTCPAACDDPTVACPDVCGAPRCESLPAGSCNRDVDCGDGCTCANGTCSANDVNTACDGGGFRLCETDAQCREGEYCQKCPPGAACFVADHCEPIPPQRACTADTDCLSDEHCACDANVTTDCTCAPGAPDLRYCTSDLECRPDEYCQKCPPGAACFVADHCEPRDFRTCSTDAECLPDEYCQVCPPNATCLVADHCERRPYDEWIPCGANTDCPQGMRCEMCPDGAQCFVEDHCVADQP
ncbi:MAG: hypothetical protein AB2A00_27695 [Myxococcota bacterium]